jgi:hypothetical protein
VVLGDDLDNDTSTVAIGDEALFVPFTGDADDHPRHRRHLLDRDEQLAIDDWNGLRHSENKGARRKGQRR